MIIESFDGQREGEQISAVWRQHPWVLSKATLIIIVLIALGSIPFAFWSPSWGLEFLLFFIAVAGLYGVLRYYLWMNTIFILTNQRVFAIVQSKLFQRVNNEVPLTNIQNITHIKRGVFQMLFDFGSVEIQTAGAKTAILLKDVPRPYQVQQKILAKEMGKAKI